MNEWRDVQLADLVRFRNGKSTKGLEPGAYPVYGSNGIIGTGAQHMYENAIILGRVGAYCGSVEYCPGKFWATDNTIVVEPLEQHLDTAFAAYMFRLANLNRYAGGSAQPLLTQTNLKGLSFSVPPVEAQRRIASILGAYDDLIEINRRRIAVLEEIARGLFEEVIRDSQTNPQGNCPIGEFVLKTLGGDWGTEEPDDDHTVEVRVVRGTDFSKLQCGDFRSCPTRFIKSSSADKRLLKPYDVILENSINAKTRASGSTLVATPGMIEALGGSVIAASFCRVFQLRNPEDAVVFHMWCRHLHASGEIARYQVVATNGIANFQTTQFVRDCVLPFEPAHYQEQVKFLVRLIAPVYAQQIANLTTSRDLLLPRLISGQLSVAEATRQLEEAA